MFKEILKIIPKLDNGDLNKMERRLGGRFKKIAKKFGKGLVGAIKGGGILAIGLSLVNKLLNPLKEVQEKIDEQFKTGDDLNTFAGQFGTTSGKLYKLVQYGMASGVSQDEIIQALQKFQTRVSEATANPQTDSVVKQYAGREDTADAFFDFLKGLQGLNTNEKAYVNYKIFGDRFGLKLSDLMQQDFQKLEKDLNLKGSGNYTKVLDKLGGLSNLTDVLTARRSSADLLKKGSLINEDMVRAKDRQEKIALERENQKIASYQSLANIQEGTDRIFQVVEKGFLTLTKIFEKMTGLTEAFKKLSNSRVFKGIGGFFGGDD